MNCFSAISVMRRRLVGGVIRSRCRSTIAALPVAVKLTAALNEVSVTRLPAGGSGIWATKQIRMMSTAGGGGKDQDNSPSPDEVFKTKEDVGAEDISTDSWKDFQFCLEEFPAFRSDEEIKIIFYDWCMTHHKVYYTDAEEKKRFAIFKDKVKFIEYNNMKNIGKRRFVICKDKVKFIEDINMKNRGFRLKLNKYADWSATEVFRY